MPARTTIIGKARAIAIATAVCGSMVVTAPGKADDATPETPDDFGTPTQEQLADSVIAWDPSDSVMTWSVGDAVTPLVKKDEDGDESTITLTSDILFKFGSAKVSDSAAGAISDALENIPKDAAVKIAGHTDSVGSAASNQKLSEKRAQSVADVIGKKRADLQLTVKGYGETKPVADNTRGGKDNPEGRAKNRRVEIRYAD